MRSPLRQVLASIVLVFAAGACESGDTGGPELIQPEAPPAPEPQPSGEAEGDGEPAAEPAAEPSSEPTAEPAAEPSSEPAAEPSSEPAAEPSSEPAAEPSSEPAAEPSAEPSSEPAAEPSSEPAAEPSSEPSAEPSSEPSSEPAAEPSAEPTSEPAASPEPEGEPDGIGCGDLLGCLGLCQDGDDECDGACIEQLSTSAEGLWDEVVACVLAECPDVTEACIGVAVDPETGPCYEVVAACAADVQGDFEVPDGTGEACGSWFACNELCEEGDDACSGACWEALSPEGKVGFQELSACLAEACPDGGDPCFGAALQEGGACAEPYLACLGFDPGAPEGTCLDVLTCVGECPAGDAACVVECEESANEESLQLYAQLTDCLDEACAGAEDAELCESTAIGPEGDCGDAFQSCLFGDVPTPGEGKCSDALFCMLTCAGDPETCTSECSSGLPPEEAALLDAFTGCMETTCPTGDDACEEAALSPGGACEDEIAACFGAVLPPPPVAVEGTCGWVFGCTEECGEGDDACYLQCLLDLTSYGLAEYLALNECLESACAEPEDESCFGDVLQKGGACEGVYQACLDPGDDPPPSEDKSCLQIIYCFEVCGGAPECIEECTEIGSAAAVSVFEPLVACVSGVCPDLADECTEEATSEGGACEEEIGACFAQSAEP